MARPSQLKIGFLGAGKMATALARAWLTEELIDKENLRACDPEPAARNSFQQATGCSVMTENALVVEQCDFLLLAVKPQNMAGLLSEIRSVVQARHLVVSIAAGVTLNQLAQGLGETRRTIRVMPNTPCLVGACAAGYAAGPHATADDVALVDHLLNTVGKAFPLPEILLNAVTGLSGSGPAFVYLMIEALSDGGVRAGLHRDVATALAAQTVFGAAKMVLETGLHPAVLKDQVTSPGGTAIAGLHALERAAVRAGLIDAVASAAQRASELGSM